MRRRALIASPLLLAAPPVRARGIIEVVTSDQRPYAMARGPEPGFVLTIVAELFRMIGLQVVYRFVPWAEAETRAGTVPGVAIAPLHRTAARKAQFLWAVPLFKVSSGFATLQPPPGSLDEARVLRRIAVLTGSLHEAFLRENGFANLALMTDYPEAMAALRQADTAAWFCELPRLRAGLGRSAQFGSPILTHPVWLALHPTTQTVPLTALREAHAALLTDGSLEHFLRPLLGASGQGRAT